MDFEKQLENSAEHTVKQFLSRDDFASLRQHYKNNFQTIVQFIYRTSPRAAIEDIINLNRSHEGIIMENFTFFQELNRAIIQDKLKEVDFK